MRSRPQTRNTWQFSHIALILLDLLVSGIKIGWTYAHINTPHCRRTAQRDVLEGKPKRRPTQVTACKAVIFRHMLQSAPFATSNEGGWHERLGTWGFLFMRRQAKRLMGK
jgi:hypothetical protein